MGQRIFIIAEAGVNHNGSLERARALITAAADAGADAVKFQTFTADNLVTRAADKAAYQLKTTGQSESQYEMIKRLELDTDAHRQLIDHCRAENIQFLSSPFDLPAIDLLCELGIDMLKIPSGEITNLPYLRKIGSTGKKIILSTGMAKLGEIEDALEILTQATTPLDHITVLHCNTEYPTPVQDVHLNAMQTIGHAFGVTVGYSDHTNGIEIPIAAAALGAAVIEKHFTLDKGLPGPDHRASLEPDELSAMIQAIRTVETALGSSVKKPTPSEIKNKPLVRKSIIARIPIARGKRFTSNNITTKRPGTGISPMEWDRVLGRTATRDFARDEPIEL